MSVLGAILGKRTWLGAGAILLSAAGGCALGALLVVKGDAAGNRDIGLELRLLGAGILRRGASGHPGQGRGDPASGVGSGSGCVSAGMAGRRRSGRPVLPGGRPVSDCRPVCGRRGGGAAGQREAPEKAPGPPRTDPEAREAEIGHGENHENAPAAKKHLTPDYTDRDHL